MSGIHLGMGEPRTNREVLDTLLRGAQEECRRLQATVADRGDRINEMAREHAQVVSDHMKVVEDLRGRLLRMERCFKDEQQTTKALRDNQANIVRERDDARHVRDEAVEALRACQEDLARAKARQVPPALPEGVLGALEALVDEGMLTQAEAYVRLVAKLRGE